MAQLSRGDDRTMAILRGPQPTAPVSQPDGFAGDAEKGDGTAQAGYATPDLGPFECENCVHFQPPGHCDHPQVMSDPEVQGQVDPQGCCNFFQSAHNESQAEEHGEENPVPEQE